MSESLVSPDAIFKIAGRDYLFEGSFAAFKALQVALKKDITEIHANIFQMRLDEFVTLLHVLVKLSGGILSEEEIGQWLVDDVGVDSAEHLMLRGEIIVFLSVAMAPKREREKKKAQTKEILQQLLSASRGENTSVSA
jgi:hypothetical protein